MDPAKMQWTQAYGKMDRAGVEGAKVDGTPENGGPVDGAGLGAVGGIEPSLNGSTGAGAPAEGVNGSCNDAAIVDGAAGQTKGSNGAASEVPAGINGDSLGPTPVNPAPAPTSSGSQAETLPEHTHQTPHYDADLAGEILRVQAQLKPDATEDDFAPITRKLNHTRNSSYVVPDAKRTQPFSPSDQMTPYIAHPVHEPVPMAMVNRPPYGPPNHRSVRNPQNEAWLSALRHAKKNIFIQSPTLNAEPLLPAIVDACERGVDVYCYICIGYNDAGELLPKQGGHNESIPPKLLAQLTPQGAKHLHYHWYVAKDHGVPLVQTGGRRACHIKLLIADERVGIVGSGNQDTQSWFQSQEVNVMLDSAEICRGWIDGLRRNQNTGLYGKLQEDGVWRDAEGKEVEGAMGVDPGRFSWAKGVVGAVRRVQGKGGFG